MCVVMRLTISYSVTDILAQSSGAVRLNCFRCGNSGIICPTNAIYGSIDFNADWHVIKLNQEINRTLCWLEIIQGSFASVSCLYSANDVFIREHGYYINEM